MSLATGHWFITIATLLFSKFYFPSDPALDTNKPFQSHSTLQSLYALVEADAAWESAIGEAMSLLRRDEARYAGFAIIVHYDKTHSSHSAVLCHGRHHSGLPYSLASKPSPPISTVSDNCSRH